jgi:regulator of sigma E protease
MNEILLVLLFGFGILGPLVFVHELGHFLVAKWLGVKVLSFSIGMGPRLLGFRRGETDYRISLLPIGGYVKMSGESPEEEERTADPRDFLEKPWWARALISAAGPFANLAFALVLNSITPVVVGVTVQDLPAVVGRAKPGTVAAQAGIRDHDRILSLDGSSAQTVLLVRIHEAGGSGSAELRVQRGAEIVTLAFPRDSAATLGQGLEWELDTVIGRVQLGLPAYLAGLRDGDKILSIDGAPVRSWSELSSRIRQRPETPLNLRVRRGNQEFNLKVRTTDASVIGILPPENISVRKRFSLQEAVPVGVEQTWVLIGQIYGGLWHLMLHPVKIGENVAGPIAIAQVARDQARGGLDQFLFFASFVSLALMAMNLLPIPILDGGHVFFALLEAVRRRPISLKMQMLCQRAGLAVLVGLVVFSFANDLTRVTQRRRAEADISRRLSAPAPADSARAPDAP